MIRLEDAELEERFGPAYTHYRNEVPALNTETLENLQLSHYLGA